MAAQWGAISAADFFTVEVVTIRGLCRYHVFFVLDLATRKVQIVGMARNPSGVWVKNVFRRLTDEVDGFLRNSRYLILDRDPLYTADARKVLKWSGVKVVRLPPYSPNLDAYAERFVGSVRRECLHRVIPLGEWHLRRLPSDYEKHYIHERNHQSLENRLIEPLIASNGIGPVRRDSRAGGLLSFYTSQAA